MNILALETSTNFCSVAISKDQQIFEKEELLPQQHAQVLLTFIDELLAKANLKLSMVDALAYSAGPGSFTGIRIGAAVIQGIAVVRNVITLAVPSLQVIAQGYYRKTGVEQVVILLDARMEQFYFGSYELNKDKMMVATQADEIISREDIKFDHKLVITDSKLISEHCVNVITNHHPSAIDVLHLAEYMKSQGIETSVEEALPIYLRSESTWKKQS